MELRHLRYFVAVAEEESVARAAVRLHVSAPPLSRQVRDLESELGVALLERGPRSVRLTQAGRRFLPEARAVLARAACAVSAVGDDAARAAAVPRLRVGLPGPGHVEYMRRRVDWVRRGWPQAKFDFESAPFPQLMARLDAGTFDVVCLHQPLPAFALGRVEAGQWASRTAYRTSLVAVLPRAHRLAGERRVALADLAGEDFVLPARTGPEHFSDLLLAFCRRAGVNLRVERWLEGPFTGPMAAVAVGAGVSVLPAAVRCVRFRGVTFRSLAPPAPTLTYTLIWRRPAGKMDRCLEEFVRGPRSLPAKSAVPSAAAAPGVPGCARADQARSNAAAAVG